MNCSKRMQDLWSQCTTLITHSPEINLTDSQCDALYKSCLNRKFTNFEIEDIVKTYLTTQSVIGYVNDSISPYKTRYRAVCKLYLGLMHRRLIEHFGSAEILQEAIVLHEMRR